MSGEIHLPEGRILRAHDSDGAAASNAFTILWHHGTPQSGALLPPLLDAAARRSIRLLSYGRPSYGGSAPRPGRRVGKAAADVAQIADALEIERFAVMGASGGRAARPRLCRAFARAGDRGCDTRWAGAVLE